jgi:murein DD-endopeptidase MepM/ murein hydrolase activator NlpD
MPAQGIASHTRMVRLGLTAGLAVSALVLPVAVATSAQAQETTHSSRVKDVDGRSTVKVAAVSTNRGALDDERGVPTTPFSGKQISGKRTSAKTTGAIEATNLTNLSQSSTNAGLPTTATVGTLAASTSLTIATSSSSAFVAPLSALRITEAYGVAGSRWSSGHHTGVDFAAATGTSVKAVTAGTVVKAGYDGAYGNDVIVMTADGKYVLFAHLSSVGVTVGSTVTPGQQIGLSGATGNVTGPHLHFEVRTTPNYGSDVDPVAYLRAHGVNV